MATFRIVRALLYIALFLFSVVTLALTAVRLHYTTRTRSDLSLRNGGAFYDPVIPEILASSVLALLFSLYMIFSLFSRNKRRSHPRIWLELLGLFILWGLWFGGAIASAVQWHSLLWCKQYEPCRVLMAMMAFTWIGWVTLTTLFVLTLFFGRRLWNEQSHAIEWHHHRFYNKEEA